MHVFSVDVDWAAPISEEAPSGADLEYSQEFAELEAAATPTPEQEFGEVLIPAKAPEWQRVLELSTELSRRSHDLRVVLWLARAATRLRGLAGLAGAVEAAEILLREKWTSVHPQTVVDGIDDPHIRYGVLCEFAAPDGLVADLRQATGLQSPMGSLSIRDLERLVEQGAVEVDGVSITRSQVNEMVRDLQHNEQKPSQLLDGLLECLGNMQQIVEARLGAELMPDWTPLRRPLERARAALHGEPATGSAAAGGKLGLHDAGTLPDNAGVPTRRLDVLTSRADVIKAMDAICSYLDYHEPSNPAPLLIRRAKRLMGMSFMEIVQDMSPDGVNQVAFIAGQEVGDTQ